MAKGSIIYRDSSDRGVAFMAYGLVIDLKKCVGCNACRVNCKQSNGTPPGVDRCRVEKRLEGIYPQVRRVIIPLLCMQCGNAPCIKRCPTGASHKEENGIVVIDQSICIGCKLCISVCPYHARSCRENESGYFGSELTPHEAVKYEHKQKGMIDKCDLCKENGHLFTDGLPVCVQACVTGARIFGNLEELQELINERAGFQLLPEENTLPSVWYLPDIPYV